MNENSQVWHIKRRRAEYMAEYKRIKRELVARGAIIDYYQDTMLIPNGNTEKWGLIDHKGAAAVVTRSR